MAARPSADPERLGVVDQQVDLDAVAITTPACMVHAEHR
jgi:hypothetical protein